MTYVHVLSEDYQYDGSCVLGVFETRAKAVVELESMNDKNRYRGDRPIKKICSNAKQASYRLPHTPSDCVYNVTRFKVL
jgi:hypothetical protein